jgi:hypothetical protein
MRRLIQPSFHDRAIMEMARTQDIAVPGTISVVFGWIPIGGDDAYGRCVDGIMGGPYRPVIGRVEKKKTDDRRAAFTDADFKLSLGLLKHEFFWDRCCVTWLDCRPMYGLSRLLHIQERRDHTSTNSGENSCAL